MICVVFQSGKEYNMNNIVLKHRLARAMNGGHELVDDHKETQKLNNQIKLDGV